MRRQRALLMTAALLLVPPPLYAQATLARGGGGISVLGPASALAQPLRAKMAGVVPRGQSRQQGQNGQNACSIYGFVGGLSGGGTLSSIGVFDLTGQSQGGFSLGTRAATASGTAGSLQANVGAAPQGGIAGQVSRRPAGTLLTVATTTGCGPGTAFTTTLISNPAGRGNTVVATFKRHRIKATYTVSYSYDPNNPYYCYYSNNPSNYFPCNIFYARVNFDFLTSTFPAQGAGNYSLRIVQATVNVQ